MATVKTIEILSAKFTYSATISRDYTQKWMKQLLSHCFIAFASIAQWSEAFE
jgi:hypothetical protein